ncbi:sigma-E factor negative regulatory protein RseA [Duganella sp. 3397]|uniref:sigma-E factor negative regulatory protein n=1 Tax=Duganella sp. 3397 TaxID=2817732 RepID=UPI00286613F7|nr:sigma-E factor negative regulatory protein [Duganella sp. 3397]MDR7049637.1 sigma-E factor negative regulatory protein RseA [Duganella sp. 3397]
MDTHKRLHENISALADGELAQSEQELAFAALQTAEGRAAWKAYHVVGDVLRDSAQGALSAGFNAALAARLAAEAAYELSPLTPGVNDAAAPPFPGAANGAAASAATATVNATGAAAAASAGSGSTTNGATTAAATTAATTANAQGQDQSTAHVILP